MLKVNFSIYNFLIKMFWIGTSVGSQQFSDSALLGLGMNLIASSTTSHELDEIVLMDWIMLWLTWLTWLMGNRACLDVGEASQ